MNDEQNLAGAVTRRQAVAGIAIAFASMAAGSRARGQDQQQPAREATAARPRTSLHYEVDYKAAGQRIYELLLDPKQFASMTGRPAEIDASNGGAFSLFGGLILGRNIELVPARRIVQAWRPGSWEPGVYSIVKFEFRDHDSQTRLVLDHTGFPEGDADGLESGWKGHYLDPLTKFLA